MIDDGAPQFGALQTVKAGIRYSPESQPTVKAREHLVPKKGP